MVSLGLILAAAVAVNCNQLAREHVAERYGFQDMSRHEMVQVITGSDILTRQYNIFRERCLQKQEK